MNPLNAATNLQMTLSEWRQLFLAGVGWTVVGQLYVIGGISVVTFALLVLRGWRRRRFEALDAFYGDVIMNELIETATAHDAPLVNIPAPRSYQWFRRHSLKVILLNHVRSIAGHEKTRLVKTYCQLGFANQDRDDCYSMFWWRRLRGVSSLSGLDLHDSAVIFDELREDSEELVAMAATLALSGVRHSLNGAAILKDLSAKALRRRNLLLQIANNWARVYGPSFVFVCLRSETRDELIKVYVAALAELNSPEVGPGLTEWLTIKNRHPEPKTLVYILRTLKSIGDPSSVALAKLFLTHDDDSVRAEALGLIAHLGETSDYMPVFEALVNDPSLSIQRVLRQIRSREKAVA